jgi:trimeric autotransporter adhesin
MKKNITLLLLTVISLNFAQAQNWDSVGAGINHQGVSALAVYSGELYAGGRFSTAGGVQVNNIAKWNGTSWSAVGSGINGVKGAINTLIIYNGSLYAGGGFDSAGGIQASNIAEWNGTTWSAVGTGITGANYSFVNSLAVYNGSLCAGGYFDSAGGNPASNIALWNGTAWSALGTGLKGTGNYNGAVYALAAYDSVLYVGGDFDTAGNNPVSFIAQWNGSTWAAVGTGLSKYIISWVTCMTIYNRSLYAGGYFDTAGGMPVNYIARWNGANWDSVLSGVQPYFTIAECMTVANSSLYIGGGFDSAGGVRANDVAVWNGTNWDSVGTGFKDSGVNALCEYNGQLYAGGIFLNSGSTVTQHIARFNIPTGINSINSIANSINLYPNPNNGQFTIQSSVLSSRWSVEVYNVFGELVYSSRRDPSGQLTTYPKGVHSDNSQFIPKGFIRTIDLSSQPNGVYLYRLVDETGELAAEGKFVVEK